MSSFNHIYMGVVVPISIMIPLTVGAYKYKNLHKEMKIIFYYLLLNGGINLIAKIFAIYRMNNLPLLHIFTILEFLAISFFYLAVLKDQSVHKVIRILMFVFPILCVINFTFFQSVFQFNTYTRPLEALIVMMYSLSYFAQTNEIEKKWGAYPVNWISTAFLFYFSGALFVFSFSNITSSVINSKYVGLDTLVWNIHATLVLVMYLLISRGFSKCTIA